MYYSILFGILYLVLAAAARNLNPLTQIKWLRGNKGMAVGILVVTIVFAAGPLAFGDERRSEGFYSELGLDWPNRGPNDQCPEDARLGWGSNLWVGYEKELVDLGPVEVLGDAAYTHQSCVNERDRNSIDRACGTLLARWGDLSGGLGQCDDGVAIGKVKWTPLRGNGGKSYFGLGAWKGEGESETIGIVLGYQY